MKDKSIRRQIGDIFGVLIPKNGWESIFAELDKENRLNNKSIKEVLLVILKRLEELEHEE